MRDLDPAPLAARTRDAYGQHVRTYGAWLAGQPDPELAITEPRGRDHAARDFKRYLKVKRGWKPSSVNRALAAVDHFNRFLGLGSANVKREPLAQSSPRALSEGQQRALLRAAEVARPRDRAIVTLLLYTPLRLHELVALDVEDVSVSARKGLLVGPLREGGCVSGWSVWEHERLISCWTLDEADWRLLANKTGASRLGFAVLLKFFDLEGRFPASAEELPQVAVDYVAGLVKVPAAELTRYGFSGRTIECHRAQIRSERGFREANGDDERRMVDWLAGGLCPVELHHTRLREDLLARFREERIEPPGNSRIDRILGSGRAQFERHFTTMTIERL